MEERILGNGLKVSAIGLGCMGFSHAYGKPTNKKEAIELIQKSIDLGYTFLILQKYMEHQRILIKMKSF